MMRRFERLSSAVADQQPLTSLEFITLRVASKVVVVVENQNLRVGSGELAEEVGRGQTTNATAHDYEVVRFVLVDRIRPGFSVAHGVSDLPGSIVTPAQPSLGRRIIGGVFFGSRICRGQHL